MPSIKISTLHFAHLALVMLILWQTNVYGQTILSGQINSFDSLVSYNSGPCGDEIVSAGRTAFTAGDLVLIYSKLEATCSLTNNNNFGDVQNLNETGHYQLVRVQQVLANVLILSTNLKHNFPLGSQLVKVPEYQSARVNTSIHAPKYTNGLGGILCLKADKFILNGTVEATGRGLSGGFSSANMGYACGATDYFYPASNFNGAPKGQGITPLNGAYANGRGKASNGGGGGNNHNAGGGGGGNAGAGGKGGDEWSNCTPIASVGGLGGEDLAVDTSRFYFGGGGGSGHNNLSNVSSEGGDGGGLILIFADTIEVLSGSISANGLDGKSMSNGAEGSGGGGAGGSIVLQFSKLTGNLTLNANGANGGNSTGGSAGPGGGGGGGSIFLPPNSAVDYSSGSLNLAYNAGSAGHLANQSNNYGSLPGQAGSENRNLVIPIPMLGGGLANPSNILGNDTTICLLDSLLLVANVPGLKTWSTGATSDSIYVNSAGNYWIEIIQGACIMRDTIQVAVINAQPFSLGPDTSVCGASFRLSAPISGNWLWSTGNTQDSVITISQTGWYWLSIGSANCNYVDSIYLVFMPYPDFDLPAEIILCEGDSINLSAPNGLIFTWNDGYPLRQRWINTPGLYWLEVSAANGCIMRDSTIVSISNNLDSSELFHGSDTTYCIEEGITFDFINLGLDLVWQDGVNSNVRRFSSSRLIWAEYTSQCGIKRDSIFIEATQCDSCRITFPNAFSPNSDGLNELFLLQSVCDFEAYHLKIFSRWGELIFESKSESHAWDGYYKGQIAMEGSYTYVLIYKLPFQETKQKLGFLSLIR